MLLLKLISGPVHTVFTVTGTSPNGLNSTVQVRVTELPTVMMPVGSLVILTVGKGTIHVWSIIYIVSEKA